MKKTVKLTALLLSMALYLTACDNNNASAPHVHDWDEWIVTTKPTASKAGEETRECKLDPEHYETREVPKLATYTVTFDSNGGSDVESKTATQGGKLSKPTDPVKGKGEGFKFGGWYKEQGLDNNWDFNDAVTKNMTLYAKWVLTYNVGDTGLGGGRIFYRNEAGFTLYADADDEVGTTAYYLEAAPAAMPTTLKWASSAIDVATQTDIGTGRKNTARILAIEAAAPAAKACVDYRSSAKGEVDDWFLPSFDELNEMYKIGSLGGMNEQYWSSSQFSNQNFASALNFLNGVRVTSMKTNAWKVRPIRAF